MSRQSNLMTSDPTNYSECTCTAEDLEFDPTGHAEGCPCAEDDEGAESDPLRAEYGPCYECGSETPERHGRYAMLIDGVGCEVCGVCRDAPELSPEEWDPSPNCRCEQCGPRGPFTCIGGRDD